jgi:hypothetical protein
MIYFTQFRRLTREIGFKYLLKLRQRVLTLLAVCLVPPEHTDKAGPSRSTNSKNQSADDGLVKPPCASSHDIAALSQSSAFI